VNTPRLGILRPGNPGRASADLEVTANGDGERLKRGEVPRGRSAGVRCQAVSKSGEGRNATEGVPYSA